MARNQPLHKEFVNILNRLETFQKFPHSFISKEVLACAGFFFAPNLINGEFDLCVCFSCGVKLFKWEQYDDPWEEHRKFDKVNCDYMDKHYKEKPNLKFFAPQAYKSPAPPEELHRIQATPTHHQQNIRTWSQQPALAPLNSNSGQLYSPSAPTRMAFNLAPMSKSSKPDYNLEEPPMSQEKTNPNSCVYVKSPASQPFDAYYAIRPELDINNQAQYSPSSPGPRSNLNLTFPFNIPIIRPPNPNNIFPPMYSEFPSLRPLRPRMPHSSALVQNQTNQFPASQVRLETYSAAPPNSGIYTQRPGGNQLSGPSPPYAPMYDKPFTQPQVLSPPLNFRPQYYTRTHVPSPYTRTHAPSPYTQTPARQFTEPNRPHFDPEPNNFPPSFQKQT